jgi:phosphatidylglycerol lysyltransferase
MDLLFISLIQIAQAQGYRWFNLGMAPLAGLPQHRLASKWARAGTMFSRHADSFYNFEGLRTFKSKFKPEWRSKYLAYPGGLSLAQVIIDVIALISESRKRVERRSLA